LNENVTLNKQPMFLYVRLRRFKHVVVYVKNDVLVLGFRTYFPMLTLGHQTFRKH